MWWKNKSWTNCALSFVFGTFICINVISALQTSTHRTIAADKHIKSFNEQLVNSRGKTNTENNAAKKRLSKRFDQYLTMARDMLQNRGSYVKSIRSPSGQERTTLVPVVDHFAGIRAWTVPYNDISKDSLDSKSGDTMINDQHEVVFKPLPSGAARRDTMSSREAIFDEAYKASEELAGLAPEIDIFKDVALKPFNRESSNFDVDRHDYFEPFAKVYSYTGRDTAPERFNNHNSELHLTRVADSKDFFDSFTNGKWGNILNQNTLQKEQHERKHSGRRDPDFGTFQSISAEDPFSDMKGGTSSFGKFSPTNSLYSDPFPAFTSQESKWGQAKNRDLGSKLFGFLQSEGSFSNDESDCEDIDIRTCSSNEDCSCYGLYECSDGMCSSKTQPLPDTDRDVVEDGFWHSGPYSEEELGVSR